MIKVFCDVCKKETTHDGPRILLQLIPSIRECETTYKLTPCQKCFDQLMAKMKHEGYDRI